MVHEHLERFYTGYLYDAHPMSMLIGVTGALSSYYHEAMDIHDPLDRELTAIRVIAKDAYLGGALLQALCRSSFCLFQR